MTLRHSPLNFSNHVFAYFKVTIIAICLLLLLVEIFLNPLSFVYTLPGHFNPDAFILGSVPSNLATKQLVEYVWFGSHYTIELSAQAIAHMRDVRSLFIFGQWVLLILLGVAALICKGKKLVQIRQLFTRASKFALYILGTLVALGLAGGFNAFFIAFHRIFFTNTLWLFPPNDTLVLYFPEYFFEAIAVQLVIGSAIVLGVFLLFLRYKESKQRLSSSKPAQHI